MKISYKVLFVAVLSIAGTNAFAADITGLATTNYVKGAIQSLDGTVTGTTGVVKTISQTDGKITAERGLIGDTEVDKISTSKINGNLDVSRITKGQTTDNIVNVTVSDGTDGKQVVTYSKGDATSTDNYPSVKAANQIAAAAAANATTELNSNVSSLINDLAALEQTVEDNKGAADDAIANLNGNVTGTSGVVKTISQTAGKVTASRGLVDKSDLASDVQTSLGKADTALQAVPVATSTALGGVKSGGDITVAAGGAVTVGHATTAGSATNATQDASGRVITDTYATKTELNNKQATLTTGENGNIKG
ncbi:MAG: hypothetical protein ACI4NZ_03695, partial [Candidatus Enterousia sp.]